MPLCQITISANAGAALTVGKFRIWVDALHRRHVDGFSSVSPDLWGRMRAHPAFVDPALLFYTHRHPDHYSRTLTRQALDCWPGAVLAMPELEFDGQILLSGREVHLRLGGAELRFRRLVHEGPQYASVPHYGCILAHSGFRVLLTGDCALAGQDLADFIGDTPIDLAVMDFPWVTLRKGREFIRSVIRPRHLVVNHLPFAGDDTHNYRAATVRSAARLVELDTRLLMEPFQTEIFD